MVSKVNAPSVQSKDFSCELNRRKAAKEKDRSDLGRRMSPGVDFAQGLDRHFRINLRGVEPRVSE